MGTSHIEFENFITPKLVETAHGKCIHAQESRDQGFADTGWRAALARDDKLLKALERGAEIIDAASESQTGRTRRDTGTEVYGHTIAHTEATLWREAYRLCDEGNPIRNFEWIYGAAAWICGYNC
jgi:hypothetical protein